MGRRANAYAKSLGGTYKRAYAKGHRDGIVYAEAAYEAILKAVMAEHGLEELRFNERTLEETGERFRLAARNDPETGVTTYLLLEAHAEAQKAGVG